jgi:hypothetical protein
MSMMVMERRLGMNETLDLIQKLSNERLNLYWMAGHQHLSPDQLSRMNELTGRLSTLWDQHRRELASDRRYVKGQKLYPELEAA